MEVWFKLWCDKCNAINWLCDGDPSDLASGCDMDGFICHKCKEPNFLIEDEILRKVIGGDNPDCFGVGEKRP